MLTLFKKIGHTRSVHGISWTVDAVKFIIINWMNKNIAGIYVGGITGKTRKIVQNGDFFKVIP